MKKQVMISVTVLAALSMVGCGQMGSTTGSSSLSDLSSVSIPRVTAAVAGQSVSSMSMSIVAMAQSVQAESVNSCTNCTSFNSVMGAAQGGFSAASYIDYQACLAEVAVNVKDTTLVNGTTFYMTDSSGNTSRVKVTAPNNQLQSFKVEKCSSSNVQNWAIKLDATTTPVTGYIKINNTAFGVTNKYYGHVSGSYDNGVWSTKTWTGHSVSLDNTNTATAYNSLSVSQMGAYTQTSYANVNVATPSSSYALWAQLQVSGNQWKNFVYGTGSTQIQFGANAAQILTFNPGLNQETTSDVSGLYESAAAASTLPTSSDSIPEADFSGDEIWDCSVPAGETVLQYSDLQAAAVNQVAVCSSQYN